MITAFERLKFEARRHADASERILLSTAAAVESGVAGWLPEDVSEAAKDSELDAEIAQWLESLLPQNAKIRLRSCGGGSLADQTYHNLRIRYRAIRAEMGA